MIYEQSVFAARHIPLLSARTIPMEYCGSTLIWSTERSAQPLASSAIHADNARGGT
jgi:hypothetical protein